MVHDAQLMALRAQLMALVAQLTVPRAQLMVVLLVLSVCACCLSNALLPHLHTTAGIPQLANLCLLSGQREACLGQTCDGCSLTMLGTETG